MYRSIETDTWADPWFSELSAPGKLVFLYLITNNHVDAAGCCEITLRVAAFETGLEQDLLAKILPKLAPQIIWWPDLNIFWVRNFLRRQSANTNATNFFKSAARSLDARPETVIQTVCAEYPSLPMHPEPPEESAMHPDASPMHAVTVTETVTEQQQKQERRQPSVASVPQAAHRAMFGALSDVFGMPTPGTEHKRYEAAAKELITAGADPSEIPRLHEAWGWINPGPPRVNSLAGQLTVLRNAKPRASPVRIIDKAKTHVVPAGGAFKVRKAE